MLQQAEFTGRIHFGDFLNKRGLAGSGVEVGTHRGEFARTILEVWKGFLFCVDPWCNLPEYEAQAKYLWGNGDREEDYRTAQFNLKHLHHKLVRETSETAAKLIPDGLDFVYLDGDHSWNGIVTDLGLWWPKLRSGGILAGHDFVCHSKGEDDWGRNIQPAVLGLAAMNRVDVNLVVEVECLPWSYYLVKP